MGSRLVAMINLMLDILNPFHSDELSLTFFDTIRLKLPVFYFKGSQVELDIF